MLKITIEGPQGSGKTTAADIIAEALTKAGYLVESRSEEGGSETLSVARPSGLYKFRAECRADVYRLLMLVSADHVEIKSIWGGDVEVTIDRPRRVYGHNNKSVMSLSGLANLIREKIVDSHVMVETLRLASEYTGERT